MDASLRIVLRIAAASLVVLAFGAVAQAAASSFYEATPQELAGKPGTIIRAEPLATSVPPGATAYRILYRSTGLRGEPIAVSAVVALPEGPAPAEGRPIVAWQHPTSGVDEPCAPSLSPSVLRMIQGLPAMLRLGYAVVATDYPGMGAPGPHPYLVGLSEGRAVLDAVRAVRSLPEAHAGNRFALWGHSQGGHASLFAAQLARSYAPELKLVGVAAAAPASNLTLLSKIVADNPSSLLMGAMFLWSWSRVFDIPLDKVVAPGDLSSVDLLARVCFDPPYNGAAQPPDKSIPSASFKLTQDLASAEPWRSLYVRNTPGAPPSDVPVFLAQGSADTTILPALTAGYMQRLCKAGDTVHLLTIEGVNHHFIAREASGQAVDWIADRFAGKPAPNDCRK